MFSFCLLCFLQYLGSLAHIWNQRLWSVGLIYRFSSWVWSQQTSHLVPPPIICLPSMPSVWYRSTGGEIQCWQKFPFWTDLRSNSLSTNLIINHNIGNHKSDLRSAHKSMFQPNDEAHPMQIPTLLKMNCDRRLTFDVSQHHPKTDSSYAEIKWCSEVLIKTLIKETRILHWKRHQFLITLNAQIQTHQ